MSISQRARSVSGTVQEMPESEKPISEQFRITAKAWCDAEAAAQLLEDTKSAVLSQRMMALGDMPVSKAEMRVKASLDWHDHIAKIVDARKEANLKKVQLDYLKMKHMEYTNANANYRAERKMV